jgi:cytochrome oxidase Cu insertion factor (SCO1/SenC/PrrC family)
VVCVVCQDGKNVSLKQFTQAGKYTVVYFYNKVRRQTR